MKSQNILITGLAALSLSACGATTGGVAKSLAEKTAVPASSKQDDIMLAVDVIPEPTLDAVKLTGNEMGCETLVAELKQTEDVIQSSNEILTKSESNKMANELAKAGASKLANKALSNVPFVGMFAKRSVTQVMNRGVDIQQTQATLQEANLRKATLTGMYAGKNCGT